MADQRRYDVVLTGQIEPDRAQEEVVLALAALFRIETARAERMLTRAPRVLRREAPARKAARYFRVLTQAGAEVAIEPVGLVGLRPRAAVPSEDTEPLASTILLDEDRPPVFARPRPRSTPDETNAPADEPPPTTPDLPPAPAAPPRGRRGLLLSAVLTAFALGGGAGYRLASVSGPPVPAAAVTAVPAPATAPAPVGAPVAPPVPASPPAPPAPVTPVAAPDPAALTVVPTPAAPFGLRPAQDVAALGLQAVAGQSQPLAGIPRPHPLFDRYRVRVGPDGGLCWLEARAPVRAIAPDGAALRALFARVEADLTTAYGPVARSDVQLAGTQLTAPEQWMAALVRRERYLNSLWSPATGADLPAGFTRVVLRAVADGEDTGAVTLEFDFGEGCPAAP